MGSEPFPLRCKSRTGVVQIECLTKASTLREFKIVASNLTNISPERLIVRRGYPPAAIELSDETKLVTEVFTAKEILIIEEAATSVPFYKPSTTTKSIQPPAVIYQSPFLTVPSKKGILMRRVVPANNSCLFTSINFCLTNGRYEEESGTFLRHIIAKTVEQDKITYNEAFLGKPNAEYVTWILNDTHWGGAIEISILSAHYSIEIVVVDTQNTRLNRFGEDKDYSNRILIIYDGIHYDPLMLDFSDTENNIKKIQTIFPKSDDIILSLALELAQEAKSSRQFTDLKNFKIKCLQCNGALRGENEARQHAKETGHINFGEL